MENTFITVVSSLHGRRKFLWEIQAIKVKTYGKMGVAHVIDLLSSLFLPFINLMVSVGILKGILVLMVANGIVTDGTTTYDILNAMSDAFFYFIPLFLAYTAAKKF